ncbi:hypothetical protein HDZ31DRAFT_65845 [Schizophyllum fasciatum]
MVATKTSKATKAKAAAPKAKYTYRERVLDACSTLQREKKRIHMATLRAQVHKAAEARNDKMGQNSNRFIHKAVDGLVDEGMLMRCPEPATVSVTPEAKQTFRAARKSLNISAASSASPADQELFIRLVSHSPRKRPRQSNVRFEGSADADFGDSISTHSKRPRRSIGASRKSRSSLPGTSRAPRRSMGQPSASQGPKPLSRMTKAELLAKIKELTERQQALRSDSPLTQVSDDEVGQVNEERLREQAQHYRERIEELEQQLALGFASAIGGPGGATQPDDTMDLDERATSPMEDVPTRPSSPTLDIPSISEPNSPTHAVMPSQPRNQAQRLLGVTRTDPRAPLGMMRTQSGSFISHLSKRPTPAPSDSGDDHHIEMAVMPYDHEQDPFGHELSQSQGTALESTQGERDAHEKVANLEQQLATLKQDLVDVRSASAATEMRLQRSAQALEDKAVAREKTITGLESDVAQAQLRESAAQSLVKKKDQEVADLQSRLDQAAADSESSRLVAAQQEQALRGSVQQLEQALAARDAIVTEQAAALADYEGRLVAATTIGEDLAARLARTDAERTRLLSELEGTLVAKVEVQRQFREQLQALQSAVADTDKEMKELETDRDQLRADRDRLQAVSQSLEEDVTGLRRQLEEERKQVVLTSAQVADRDARLAAQSRNADELGDKINAYASQVSSLEYQRSVGNEKVAELERALEASREEAATMTEARDRESAKASDLRARLEATEESKQELRSVLADRDARLATVSADLATSQQQRDATREELATMHKLAETQQARATSLASILEQTKAVLLAVQSEAGSLRAAKQHDEETITRMKDNFAKYKVQQSRWLSDMSSEFDAAHASTVSNDQQQRVAETI